MQGMTGGAGPRLQQWTLALDGEVHAKKVGVRVALGGMATLH
jgi:hypothetical protein